MKRNRTPDVEVLEEFSNSDDMDVFEETELYEVKIKKKRKKVFLLLYVAIAVFAVYSVFTLVNQHIKISDKQAQLDMLNESISVQEIQNDDIKQVYNLTDKDDENYIEQKARENGYLHEGERVFVNISGD